VAVAEVSASSEARKRVPIRVPCAPSINARPRPSAVPPAATHHDLVVALPHGVDDCRHERQSRARSAVPAGLRTLGDDDVSADIKASIACATVWT